MDGLPNGRYPPRLLELLQQRDGFVLIRPLTHEETDLLAAAGRQVDMELKDGAAI
jgi:hypothetical protein